MQATALSAMLMLVVCGATIARGDDWPAFRGPYRDNLCRETGLLASWPDDGPKLLWQTRELGAGSSNVSIVGALAYTMGQRNGYEWVIALDTAREGKVVWATPVGPIRPTAGGQPGPKSTPAIHREKVYTLGLAGDLMCIDAADGKVVWRKNLVTDFGGEMPRFGYGESVLVDGRWLLCTPGGSVCTMLALWRLNGEKVWGCPIGDAAAYSSIIKTSLGRTHQYVQFTGNALVGVKVRGGKMLWKYEKAAGEALNYNTPIWYGQTVFASSGPEPGGGLVWIQNRGEESFELKEMYFSEKMAVPRGDMVLVGGTLFGSVGEEGVLTCLDFKSGDVCWEDETCGPCSILYADGLLYCRSEKGTLSLVEASREGFRLRGRFEPPKQSRSGQWASPVISGKKLYLRDQNLLACFDLDPSSYAEEEEAE